MSRTLMPANSLETASADLTSGGMQYVKFKKGEWVIGREEDTFPDNSFEAVPDLPNIQFGWVCWKDGQLIDEIWYGLGEELASQDMLPDHGPYTQDNDGWGKQVRFQMNILPTGSWKLVSMPSLLAHQTGRNVLPVR